MATHENAEEAFAGESQANRKYAAFSKKAAEEGFGNIATLLKAVSEAEAIHAKSLLAVLAEVRPTAQNLEASIEGETHESVEMYPAYIKNAKEEKKTEAVQLFTYAAKAEAVHAGLYKTALDAVKAGHDLADEKVYLCPICGHIALGKPPLRCPICSVFGKQYCEIVL